MLLVVGVLASVLTGCGGEEKGVSNSKVNEAIQAYTDRLADEDYSRCCFIYLDDDNIPELMVDKSTQYNKEYRCYMFNDDSVDFERLNGDFEYLERQGIIKVQTQYYETNGSLGVEYWIWGYDEDGNLFGSSEHFIESGTNFSHNGSISYQRYQQELAEAFPSGTIGSKSWYNTIEEAAENLK